MKCFRLVLCLQIIVHVFGIKDTPNIQQNLQPNSSKTIPPTPRPSGKDENSTQQSNSSETTPPVQTPAGKDETFNCSNLNPSFMTTITCHNPDSNETKVRFYKTGGLIISERWILSEAGFLTQLCKQYLPEGCLVGSPKPGNKCKKIIPHENFNDTTFYDLALLSVQTALPAGVVPWPKTRTFLKPLDEIVFYGQEISSEAPSRRCTTAGVVQFEFCSTVSVVCALPLNVSVARDICSGKYFGGLAVSNNIVVGILSKYDPSLPLCRYKTYSKPSDLFLRFTKIEDYYTFINNVTNITVPFESSPRGKVEAKTEESSTLMTSLETEPSPATVAISTEKTEPKDFSCSGRGKPYFFVQIFCDVTEFDESFSYSSAYGFILSRNWVLGSASQLEVCKRVLDKTMGCLIYSLRRGEKCERIILHEKFVKAKPYRYDLGLVETNESLGMLWFGETPWPGSKGFSDACTDLSFHGYEHDEHELADHRQCVTLRVAKCSDSEDHRHFKRESILCGRNEDRPDLAQSVCKREFQMGLAICKNLVVGIFSHVHNDTTSSSCYSLSPLTFVLTKIEDYYSFIHDKTGLEVPFQSSPSDVEDLERRAVRGTTSSAVKLNTTWWLLLLVSPLLLVLS